MTEETAKKNSNEEIMAEIDRKIAEMLEAAQKKADEIITAAEKRADEGQKAKEDAIKKANEELEEYVDIKLFKDNGKYKDDVFVSVNGENCVIKRGVKTRIKRKFALVLEQSDMQDFKAGELMDKREAEYKTSQEALS